MAADDSTDPVKSVALACVRGSFRVRVCESLGGNSRSQSGVGWCFTVRSVPPGAKRRLSVVLWTSDSAVWCLWLSRTPDLLLGLLRGIATGEPSIIYLFFPRLLVASPA